MVEKKLRGSIETDQEGISTLIEIYDDFKNLKNQEIVLNFNRLQWIDQNLTAILGCFLSKLMNNNNKIVFTHLKGHHKELFEDSYFLKPDFTRQTRKTIIPFVCIESWDRDLFNHYILNELFEKHRNELPFMTGEFKELLRKNIMEIFSNAWEHGECRHVFACGQVYPQKRKLLFTIVDLGVTIPKNVSKHYKRQIPGIKAIKWAIQQGNTTAIISDDDYRGTGLSDLLEFANQNNGNVQIISGDGFWEINSKNNNNFLKDFPGTIVNIIINTRDNKIYDV